MALSLRDKLYAIRSRLREDAAYRDLLRTSAWSFIIRLVGVGTGFLVTWTTARWFGAEALGIVSICIAILSIASVFGKLGLDLALVRFISTHFANGDMAGIRGIYRTAFLRVLVFSSFLALILFVAAPWLAESYLKKPHLTTVLRWNALMVVPLTVLQINSECLRGLRKIGSYTFFQTSSISSIALVSLVAAASYYPLVQAPVYIQFIAISLSAVLSLSSWLLKTGPWGSGVSHTTSKAELGEVANPMFMTTVLQLLMSFAGTLVLAAYVPESEVGVYNALVRISVFTNITILAINGLVMTRFAATHASGDKEALRVHSSEATRLILLTSLPIFLLLFLLAGPVLSVFGPDFQGREYELYVLLFVQLIVVCSGLPGQLLNMTGNHRSMRDIAIFASIVNVASCLLLIPAYGMTGACWAQVAGTSVWNILCIAEVRRRLGFFTFIGGA